MSNRFEAEMAKRMVEVLVQRGYPAIIGKPEVGLNGGCADPGHCSQHSGRTVDGKPMLSIYFGSSPHDWNAEPRMSNRGLHRLRMELLEADRERDALAQDDPSLH